MKQESLNERLAALWAAVIDGMTVDLAAHRIELTLHTLDGDKREDHDLQFLGVSAFYYVKDRGAKRFRLSAAQSLELTSATYMGADAVSVEALMPGKDSPSHYSSSPGFLLEIWTSLLMIEASTLLVNGDRYHVGPPAER